MFVWMHVCTYALCVYVCKLACRQHLYMYVCMHACACVLRSRRHCRIYILEKDERGISFYFSLSLGYIHTLRQHALLPVTASQSLRRKEREEAHQIYSHSNSTFVPSHLGPQFVRAIDVRVNCKFKTSFRFWTLT